MSSASSRRCFAGSLSPPSCFSASSSFSALSGWPRISPCASLALPRRRRAAGPCNERKSRRSFEGRARMTLKEKRTSRIEELRRRSAEAEAGGGPERREREHKAGKLAARERIHLLLDE